MTTMHEIALDALAEAGNFILERDRNHPIFQKLDEASAEIGKDFMKRREYMPTMDEAYRFIKSNPTAAAEILAEIRQRGAVE